MLAAPSSVAILQADIFKQPCESRSNYCITFPPWKEKMTNPVVLWCNMSPLELSPLLTKVRAELLEDEDSDQAPDAHDRCMSSLGASCS